MKRALVATCHCGDVSVELASPPEFINDCDCSLCRKSGAAWSYFISAEVQITGPTMAYSRRDREEPAVAVHSCQTCGCTTHWTLTDGFLAKHGAVDRLGANMRLFDVDDLQGVEMRFPDGRNWQGEGDYGYRRAPIVLGAGDAVY